jgi:hypothetical protein
MRKRENSVRSRIVGIALRHSEYEQLFVRFKNTTCQTLSEYMRDVLFSQPITVLHRSQSADEFLSVALKLKKELVAIASDHNQVVRKMHLIRDKEGLIAWTAEQESIQRTLQEKIKEIGESLDKIYQIWLRK